MSCRFLKRPGGCKLLLEFVEMPVETRLPLSVPGQVGYVLVRTESLWQHGKNMWSLGFKLHFACYESRLSRGSDFT